MQRSLKAIPALVLMSAAALVGCGTSGSSANPFGTIQVGSTAITASALPALYTCDGKDISPPLEWGPVPSGTKELVIFLINTTPSKTTAAGAFTAEWAIAGVNPELHKLAAGEVPPGARIGRGSNGKEARYSVCPAKGETKSYKIGVYSLLPAVKPRAQFTDRGLLQDVSSGPSQKAASAGGVLEVTYTRKK